METVESVLGRLMGWCLGLALCVSMLWGLPVAAAPPDVPAAANLDWTDAVGAVMHDAHIAGGSLLATRCSLNGRSARAQTEQPPSVLPM